MNDIQVFPILEQYPFSTWYSVREQIKMNSSLLKQQWGRHRLITKELLLQKGKKQKVERNHLPQHSSKQLAKQVAHRFQGMAIAFCLRHHPLELQLFPLGYRARPLIQASGLCLFTYSCFCLWGASFSNLKVITFCR